MNSVKHNDAKRAIQNSKKRDQSLLTFLRRKDEEDNPKGETLPEDMRLFRFDLVEAFLSAGIPLSKIDNLRSFFFDCTWPFIANDTVKHREREGNSKN